MIVDPAIAPVSGENGLHTLHLSVAGGITQFGAYVDTLAPGAWSSHRHWHSSEDEFLYVLEGAVTVRDDDGLHDLGPGDGAAWPHGCPNAHHLTNRGDAPCRYIIVGSRVAADICYYPDDGRQQVNSSTRWQILDEAGVILREGDLPPELLNLPPVWGALFDPINPGLRILTPVNTPWTHDENPVHPITGPGPGRYSSRLLSDPGGLTQFGAFVEELPPGSRSGHRHWHEAEDEMIVLLAGEAVLVEDSEATVRAGDTACWPAGTAVGHRLDNRSDAPVRYLVIGTRHERDIIHYTDHDLITHKDGPARRYVRRDGTEYPDRRQP
jgi:uncharacterized cupin superfamily protein